MLIPHFKFLLLLFECGILVRQHGRMAVELEGGGYLGNILIGDEEGWLDDRL